jgi:hypothetical protein
VTALAEVRDATFTPPAGMRRLERAALVCGVAGALASVLGAILYPAEQFLRAYLVGYMFWLGITLGCLAVVMLSHITGAQWGFVVRRVLECGALNVLLMAVLFLPILIGVKSLYVWARPDVRATDHLVQHQARYLNVPAFALRAVLYFAVWIALAWALNRWSTLQDSPPDRDFRLRFQQASALGLVAYVFTMTFASLDWMMSLDPHWRSTVYGFYVESGQGLMGFAFCIVAATFLMRYRPLSEVISTEHVHDLGKLMFAFLILWAYMAFSQGLIYWSANLPEEIRWYLDRTRGGWWIVGVALIFLHFLVPFTLLLGQDLKRDVSRLMPLALWLMLMRWLDLYWLIIPSFADTKGRFSFSWMNIATTLAIGGFWVLLFLYQLRRRPLVPLHDPMLAEVLAGEHA